MSETDYLTILVAQTLGVAKSIQPLIPPMFSLAQFPAPTVGTDSSRPLAGSPRPLTDVSRPHPRAPGPSILTHGHDQAADEHDALASGHGQLVPTLPPNGHDQSVPTLHLSAVGTDSSRPLSPQITLTDIEHDQLINRRDTSAPTVSDEPYATHAYDANNNASKNKTNPLQSSLPISRVISQPSLSHTSISHPIHVVTPLVSLMSMSAMLSNSQATAIKPTNLALMHSMPTRGRGEPVPTLPTHEHDEPAYGRGEPVPVPTLNAESQKMQTFDTTNILSKNNDNSSQILSSISHISPPIHVVVPLRGAMSVDATPETHSIQHNQHVGTDVSRPQAESVRVTIGRVEVRATLSTQESSQHAPVARAAQPTFSLQAYLEQRRSGKA